MKFKSSFFPSIVLFTVSLAICMIMRIWLVFRATDQVTGFYSGGETIVAVFNAMLLITFVLTFAFYLFRNTSLDYPVFAPGRALALLALLSGVTIILYQLEGLEILTDGGYNPGVLLNTLPVIGVSFFGLIAAFAFIMLGIRGLLAYRGMFGRVLPLVSGVWMLLNLVAKFNSYTTLTTISDNLLTVLFMLFCMMFLVGHARTLSGLGRKDGRNYAIPTGFCTAFCGFLLVIPNWLWSNRNDTSIFSARLLGYYESIFIFWMSVYAISFVISLTRSIKSV